MNLKYDFHIHSCLSPCGDNDMTPYNIVNMAKLLGYDIIALTDHNSCLNCPATIEAGKKIGLTVIAGMELCTAEEIHVVCLFEKCESALKFSDYVKSKMPYVQNDVEIFGNQYIMDSADNIIGSEDVLLTTASSISIDSVVEIVTEYGGVAFPAHLDRASYSVFSVLGFMYPEMGFKSVEFTHNADILKYENDHIILKNMNIVQNSDAHYLENMPEPKKTINLSSCTPKAVVDFLRTEKITI